MSLVGGSTSLTKAALDTSADMIIVYGVDFMAETVAVLNPDKKVTISDRGAVCPMAQQLFAEDLLEAKKNPDAEVLLHMNTYAKVKTLADCVCTSGNALRIAEKMSGGSPIIFGLDRGLSYYVSGRTTKEIITIHEYGYCPVHHQIALEDLLKTKKEHPGVQSRWTP